MPSSSDDSVASNKLSLAYLLTMSVLVLHQIDAAYWHEWEMFLLPGGIQGFLVFNVVVIPLVCWGYSNVVLMNDKAGFSSYLCAGLGIITGLIHVGFFLAGFDQFKLPLSGFVIFACLVCGVLQLVTTRKFV